MKNLYVMTNDELVRFANERGIQIVTSGEDLNDVDLPEMERHELSLLPTQVPRFEGLIPEVRNQIYEELLCFKNGEFSCFPEILSTNKQIHDEACGILYGKNEIQVQLSNDGILIHGDSSNEYLESRFGSRPAHTRNSLQRSLEGIEWPEHLRRVHSIKFSIIDSHKNNFSNVRKVCTENVLKSLCTFLCNDHKLQTFSVDVRRWDRQGRVVAKTADLHCLLLLDPLPTLKIEGDGICEKLTVDTEVDLRTIGRVSMARCQEFNDECQQFEQTVTHSLTPRDQHLLFTFTGTVIDAFHVHIQPAINAAKLGKDDAASRFVDFMEMVRDGMEQYDIPLRKSLALITALDKLLHFDIDVKVARHAAERLVEEMEADE